MKVLEALLVIALWITVAGAVAAAYWAPTIVAWHRRVPHRGSVAIVNALLGWTLVGWTVALAMACRTKVVTVAVEK